MLPYLDGVIEKAREEEAADDERRHSHGWRWKGSASDILAINASKVGAHVRRSNRGENDSMQRRRDFEFWEVIRVNHEYWLYRYSL